MIAPFDRTYRDRVQDEVMRAIIAASLVETAGERTAMLRSGEIIDALTLIMASIAADSEACATAAGQRDFAEALAGQVRRRLVAFRNHAHDHGSPFTPFAAGSRQ